MGEEVVLNRERVSPSMLSTIDLSGTEPAVHEAELVARARRDRQAFAPLYARYADPVYRYCYRRLGSPDAAEDATSHVFAKALVALPQYRGGSFRSWLFTIAHNVVVDTVRTRRPDLPLLAAGSFVDPTPTPEQETLAAEQRRLLHDLLGRLPDDQRRVVELRLAGLTGPEIASVLARSHAAIKSIQCRAFARLRRALVAEAEVEETKETGHGD